MNRWVFGLLLIVGTASCDLFPSGVQSDSGTFETSYENCDPSDASCSYVRVVYPVVNSGPYTTEINDWIERLLLDASRYGENAQVLSLQEVGDRFLEDYARFREEFPESAQAWYVDREMRIAHQSEDLLLLHDEVQEYTGGAHGIHTVHYTNIDLNNGKVLRLQDVFASGSQDVLAEQLEKAYRTKRGLAASDKLTDAGNLFEDTIEPSENFAITDDVVRFVYNPYDIAPYSEGVIMLDLPLESLASILIRKPERGPLS